MVLHELYAYPETDIENERKVWRIFIDLKKEVDTKTWEPRWHDERFGEFFKYI
jgi:hypothetical protein